MAASGANVAMELFPLYSMCYVAIVGGSSGMFCEADVFVSWWVANGFVNCSPIDIESRRVRECTFVDTPSGPRKRCKLKGDLVYESGIFCVHHRDMDDAELWAQAEELEYALYVTEMITEVGSSLLLYFTLGLFLPLIPRVLVMLYAREMDYLDAAPHVYIVACPAGS